MMGPRRFPLSRSTPSVFMDLPSLLCRCCWYGAVTVVFLSCMLISSTCKSVDGVAAAASSPAPVFRYKESTSDRFPLLEIKNGFSDDPNGTLKSWNESVHYCQWQGVTCSRRHPGRVTVIDLASLSLSGRLSSSISNLTFLRALNLRDNKLSTLIPPQLGSLTRLRYLSLSQNALSGEIPSNLSRCSELRHIGLADNNLTGEIPAALGGLSKLTYLNLGSNQLSGGIPASLGNLSSYALQVLELRDNQLTGGIPHELGRLKGLQVLYLHINKLSGTIPSSIYNLSNLEGFQLSRNPLLSGTLPSDLGDILPKLNHLIMGGMNLKGTIPRSLPNASSLQIIELSENKFRGTIPGNIGNLKDLLLFSINDNILKASESKDWEFLASLTNCTQLRVLCFSYNDLRGELPNSVANLSTTLEIMNMGANQIWGSIPSGIGQLVGLTRLGMGQNQLTGSIPSTFGKLSQLSGLELGPNLLSGKIPSQLGNLTALSELFLGHNRLSGIIPRNMGRQQKLQKLDLSYNVLSGNIPDQLFAFSTLIELDFSKNNLEGFIPPSIGHLLNLLSLDLSANNLSGTLPPEIGDCQGIQRLNLGSNSFEGTIPPSFKKLRSLEVLDLSHNNLTEGIPKFLEDFTYLQYLNLSFNNLIGEVPKSGVFKNANAVALIGNTRLCGGITELGLPSCSLHEKGGGKGARSPKVIVIVWAVVGVCIALFVCFMGSLRLWLWRSSKGNTGPASSSSSLESKLKRISYHDLLRITDGFSEANLIGTGGFGSVYKARLEDGITVAVKVLNCQTHGALKSFKAECEALRSIRHRNLVKIISVCCSINSSGEEFKALVYEYFPNGSLAKWLHSEDGTDMRRLSFAQRLNIAVEIASALNYLHSQCHSPIVHCDLKPSNILLDEDRVARLGDFGLARFIPSTSRQSLQSQSSTMGLLGSIGYVAPEYGLGSPVSTSGDIYSFGILLLELFTAKSPVENLFRDGLSMQKFVERALPYKIMDIVDPSLFSTRDSTELMQSLTLDGRAFTQEKIMVECLLSLMRIGLACTRAVPVERMTAGDVLKEINIIRTAYLQPQSSPSNIW